MGKSEQVGERRVHSPARLFIRGHGIECGAGNVLVPEGLFHNGQVNVLSHQRESEGMLEAMRVPPIRWQSGSFGNVLEYPEELAPVELAALLGHEHIVTGVLTL